MTMTTTDKVPAGWRPVLEDILHTPQARHLGGYLQEQERAGKPIFPPRGQRLAALALTAPEAVKVVILGQDPYHGAGQANGLAFSVNPGVRIPPSLANIFKELNRDLGLPTPSHGDLSHWARQGVLLLNNALTVEEGQAGSHQAIGWEAITDAIVAAVAHRPSPCVFMLWGSHAQKKAGRIPDLRAGPHLVLSAPHPSPLSAHRGFLGCGHFSQANAFLERHGLAAIDWRVDPPRA
jgi:uracil-DNA glycosylase